MTKRLHKVYETFLIGNDLTHREERKGEVDVLYPAFLLGQEMVGGKFYFSLIIGVFEIRPKLFNIILTLNEFKVLVFGLE